MTRPARLIVILVVIVVLLAIDLWTKRIAVAALSDGTSHEYLGGLFRLHYAENEGAFLSLGAALPPAWRTAIFVGLSGALVLGLLFHLFVDGRARAWRVVAMAMIVAGGIGNIIDRVQLGVVRDFMVVGVGPVRTGVFNVADLAITTGVIAIALASLWPRRHAASVESTNVSDPHQHPTHRGSSGAPDGDRVEP